LIARSALFAVLGYVVVPTLASAQPAAPATPTAEPAAAVPTTLPAAAGPEDTVVRAKLALLSVEYADHLFNDGDYYRAITEYRRYLYLTRGRGAAAYRAAMAIGEAYLRSRQLEAAAAQFESVAQRASEGRIRGVALLSAGRAHLLGDRHLLAAARLGEARVAAGDDVIIGDEALYLMGWARVAQQDWDSAQSIFGELSGRSGPRQVSAQSALQRFETREALDQKNALLAGVLSLIPGLGHMYLGQWTVGFAALFWNALFIFATGYSIYNAEWGVAAVLGVFELSWFSGTMFGALNGAFRHNKDLASNWLDDLVGELGNTCELGSIHEAPGLPGELERLLPLPAASAG